MTGEATQQAEFELSSDIQDSPSKRFKDNLGDVFQLLNIHRKLTGPGPGRRNNVESLNRSSIVLLCANFEAFVEDLASSAFDRLVMRASTYQSLPLSIQKSIAKEVKLDKNELSPWTLADNGWKVVAAKFRQKVIDDSISKFHSPKYGNLQSLFKTLVGFEDLETCFRWKGMPPLQAKQKLNKFVTLRGEIAHGKRPAPTVLRAEAIQYTRFLAILSVRLSNEVRDYCRNQTGDIPWYSMHFAKIDLNRP